MRYNFITVHDTKLGQTGILKNDALLSSQFLCAPPKSVIIYPNLSSLMANNTILTQEEIKKLCSDLKKVSQAAYQNEGGLKNNTYDNNYQILADEINKAINERKDAVVKTEWLRNLFVADNKGKAMSFQTLLLDACCYYVCQKSAHEYFKQPQLNNYNYYGIFDMFWKSTVTDAMYMPIVVDFQLVLSEDACTLKSSKTAERYYEGKAPIRLEGSLYVELSNPQKTEKVYIILHIGIADAEDLTHISGLYLGVDSNLRPVAGPIMLIRDTKLEATTKLLEEYFNRYPKTFIKAMQINDVKKMLIDLQLKHTIDNRLLGLFGSWYILEKYKNTETVKISKINIISNNDLHCDSYSNYYTIGKVQIIGSGNLLINLIHEQKQVFIVSGIGNKNKLSKLKYLTCLFLATGNHKPTTGRIVMVRSNKEYNSMETDFFEQDAPLLQELGFEQYKDYLFEQKPI